ncbi:histidine kinase [Priestia veravalensis]|uniref:histidine kinase n=1 Tax=Priestia veravalensis TaxID=1414648 RepID=A0A0V8JRA6_9BACI|nr:MULTISPECIES: HAMP domain-containing sensor histidine kinase [Priestia]KSU89389.1 histidine kinase [Priestia veravalensis]SCB85056.1 histidine kinase [Priestia flexa]
MSLKLRFLLTYLSMVLVFVLLLLLFGFLVFFSITGDANFLQKTYSNAYVYKLLTPEEETTFLNVKLLSQEDPNQLLNQQIIKSYEQEGIDVIVRKNEEVTYSSFSIDQRTVDKELPHFNEKSTKSATYEQDIIRIKNKFYSYIKLDFFFPNRDEGTVFVLRSISPYVGIVHKVFPFLFIFLLLLFVVIIGFVNYVVSRSVIKPIYRLKRAAERIRQGDVHFSIPYKYNSKDEINELTNSFEEMRKKLQSSIDLQVHYEENRKQLLSSISHDLKTPITSIIGYVEGIQDGVANTPEKLEKYLSTISTKAKDMNSLIDELFLFSKLDLHEVPFHFETVNINDFMENLNQELQFELEEKGVLLRFYTTLSKRAYVKVDTDKLRRVIMNLITNSIKFMDKEDKRIELVLSENESEVIVRIVDNGCGIEPRALPYIFNKFYRAEESRNTQTGGSGLGLAIAKQIIDSHGGSIWATSTLHKETSIYFSLRKITK